MKKKQRYFPVLKEVPPLENVRHEQFARCIALGNRALVCYYGVGNPKDEGAAAALARRPNIFERAKYIFSQQRPYQYRDHGFEVNDT